MAKTGVTSNIPKAMREFQKISAKLLNEGMKIEGALAVMAMDGVREKGLVQGEQNDKGRYLDLKAGTAGVINYSKPLKRGGRSKVRRIFAKNKIVARKSKLFETFEHKTQFSNGSSGLVQNRKDAKITIENFNRNRKSITFSFYGATGRNLRLLSYGQKREQVVTTSEGKELKGRKGRRDVVRNNIRRIFVGGHNKALQKYIDSDYAREFKRIK